MNSTEASVIITTLVSITSGDGIQWTSPHCPKDALTNFFGWFLQGILAGLAFTCLIGEFWLLFFSLSGSLMRR